VDTLVQQTDGGSPAQPSLSHDYAAAPAIDRYFVIVRQFQLRMTAPVCLLLVVIIWLISVAVSTPLAVHQKVFVSYILYRKICSGMGND